MYASWTVAASIALGAGLRVLGLPIVLGVCGALIFAAVVCSVLALKMDREQ